MLATDSNQRAVDDFHAWRVAAPFRVGLSANSATPPEVMCSFCVNWCWEVSRAGRCPTRKGSARQRADCGGRETGRATITLAVDSHLYDAAAYLAIPYGYSALVQGRAKTATRRFLEVMPLLREHDMLGDQRLAVSMLSQAAAIAGDLLIHSQSSQCRSWRARRVFQTY